MNLYTVNVIFSFSLLVIVLVASLVIRRRASRAVLGERQAKRLESDALQHAKGLLAKNPDSKLFRDNLRVHEFWVSQHTVNLNREESAVLPFLRFLNLATTAGVFITLAVGVFNLITNHQQEALDLNIAGLVTTIVTKGGLFLLTFVLVSAAKSLPGAVVGAVVKGAYDDWRGRKKGKSSN